MSAIFLSILRGLAQALVVAARQTQTQADDIIASFILDLLKDPATAAQKIQMFQASSAAMNDALAANAGSAGQGQTSRSGGRPMAREEVDALGEPEPVQRPNQR